MSSEIAPLQIPADRPRKKPILQIFIMVVLGILGGVVGIFFALMMRSLGPDAGPSSTELIAVALVFPIYFLTIAVHELGHLIGGMGVGFKFYAVQVGPFRISRTRTKFKFETNWVMTLMGGQAVCYPVHIENLKTRALWYFAGGPLASLISGAAALLVVIASGLFESEFSGIELIDLLLLIFGGMSIMIGLLTLIPTRMMGMPSDGARIFPLLMGQQVATRDLALLAIFGISHSGVRPRDWAPELIADALSHPEENLFGAVAHGSAYSYEFDQGNYDAARAHLQRALDAVETQNMTYRPALMTEAVYFEAAIRRDLTAALLWHERIPDRAPVPPVLRYQALAAMQAFEKNSAGVAKSIKAAKAELEESLDLGGSQAILEQLEQIEERLETSHESEVREI